MDESAVGDVQNREPRSLLTPRELEVLDAATLGLTNSEIAQRLDVSVHAVKFHLAAIYRKLEVANRTEAVVIHLRTKAPVEESKAVNS
jgi:DNA-binding NarL/FixJ family response regulator